MDNKKIILNPSSLQPLDKQIIERKMKEMEELQKEEDKRFKLIADKIIEVLVANNVLVSEVPSIMRGVTNIINPKIDGSLVEKILKL